MLLPLVVWRRFQEGVLIERTPDSIHAVYEHLVMHHPWIPGFLDEVRADEMNIVHPAGALWRLTIQIDFQVGVDAPPKGTLLIGPGVDRWRFPFIRFEPGRPLSLGRVRRHIRRAINRRIA